MEKFFDRKESVQELLGEVTLRTIDSWRSKGILFDQTHIIKLKYIKVPSQGRQKIMIKGQWLNDFLIAKEGTGDFDDLRDLEVIVENPMEESPSIP